MDLDQERFATLAAALYTQAYKREDGKPFTRGDFGAKPPAKTDKPAWQTLYTQTEEEKKSQMARMFGIGAKPDGT